MLKMPALVLVGEEDCKGMIEVDREIQKNLKSSKLVFIEDADHIPSLSNPEAFSRAVLEFLSGI